MSGSRVVKIEILGEAKGVKGAFSEAEQAAGGFGSAIGKVGQIAAGFVIGQAITKAPGFFIDAAHAAADDAASMGRLQQAVTNASGSYDKYASQIDQAIAAGQKLAFSDDETRNALANLTNETGSSEEALKRLSTAQNLARGTGMDLNTASKLLGKVTDENVTVLKRYGISIEKGASAQELLNKVDGKFKGQAAAYADTAAGKWARLKDSLSETQEAIGYKVLPIFSALTSFLLDKVVPAVNSLVERFSGPLSKAVTMVIGLFRDIVSEGGDLGVFSDDIKEMFGIDISPLVQAERFLRGAFHKTLGLVRDAMTTFRQALSGNWTNSDKVLLFHRILGQLGLLIRSVVMPAWNLLTTALGFVRRNFDGIMAVVRPLMTIMGGPLKAVLMGMLRGFGKEGLSGILPGAIQGLKDFGQAFLSLGKTALDALGKVDWAGVGKTILSGIGGALSGASDIAKGVDWGGVASTIMDALGTALSKASGIASSLLGSISGALGGADWGGVAGTIWGGIVAGFGVLSNAGGDLLSWLVGVVGGVDWSGLAGSIWGGIVAGFGMLTDAGASLLGWLVGVVTGVDWSGLAGSIWGGIVAGFVALTTAGADLLGWLTSIVTGTDWSGLAGSIWSGIVTGFYAVTDAATSLYTWLSGLVTGTDWSGLAGSLWGGIVTGFYAVTDAGAQFVAWLQSTLSGVDWSGIAGTISGGITGALSAIQSGGQSLDILGMIGLSPEKIQGVLDSLKPFTDFLSGQFTAILDNFKTSVSGVGDAFKGIDLSQVLPALKTLGEVLAGVLGVAIAGIVIQWRVFSEILSVVLPAAAQILVGAINAAAIVINTIAKVIGDVVALVDDLIHGRWSKAWDDAKRIVTDLVDGIVTYLQNWWTTVSGIFGGLVSDIIGKLEGLATDAAGKAVSIATGIIDGIKTIVTDGPGKVADMALDMLTKLGGLELDALAAAVKVATGIIDGIKTIVTDGPGKIADMGKDMVSKLGDPGVAGDVLGAAGKVGTAVIDGITSGISAAWHFLTDSLGSIATAVTNAINGAIGIVNKGINAINSAVQFTIPGISIDTHIPGVGTLSAGPWTIDPPNIPTIPELATGGIVRARPGGTVVRVGEAGQDEAVVPLPRGGNGFGGLDEDRVYQAMYRAVRDAMGSAI